MIRAPLKGALINVTGEEGGYPDQHGLSSFTIPQKKREQSPLAIPRYRRAGWGEYGQATVILRPKAASPRPFTVIRMRVEVPRPVPGVWAHSVCHGFHASGCHRGVRCEDSDAGILGIGQPRCGLPMIIHGWRRP